MSSPSSPFLRRALGVVGGGLGLVGLVFVAARLRQSSAGLPAEVAWGKAGWRIASTLPLVIGADLMLALSWRRILERLGAAVTRRGSVSIYALSQISKYAPGNVFQFVGRQALGTRAGINGAVLVKSCFWEIGVLLAGGCAFLPLLLPTYAEGVTAVGGWVLFILLAAAAIWSIRRLVGQAVAGAFLWDLAALATFGSVFAVCAVSLTAPGFQWGPSLCATLVAAHVAAWMAGLVVPGAPAGLGIREVVLLWLLHGQLPESALLPAILAARLANIAGDCLFYSIAAAAVLRKWRRDRRHAAPPTGE